MNDKCLSAICLLKNKKSKGIINFHQCPNKKTLISMRFSEMPKNKTMAIHIHEYGDIRDGCESLGSHYNPDNCNHGSYLYPQQKRHVGDLINNISTDKFGDFIYFYEDDLISLEKIIGRSIVVHENPDDLGRGNNLDSKLNGNSGKRFMCGIIGISNNTEWRKNNF